VHQSGPLGEVHQKRHLQDGPAIGGFEDIDVKEFFEGRAADPRTHSKAVRSGFGGHSIRLHINPFPQRSC
jgi:hypothetical protein